MLAPALTQAAIAVLHPRTRALVLDLHRVTFFGAAGVTALVNIRLAAANAEMAVTTDSQISWYAGSWGLSFTYPGEKGSIREVDQGLIEAARAFGASPLQIVLKVLIPEALPAIVLGLTLALVSLVGFSAMVGAVGGGGLGDLGIRYGYQRFMPDVMAVVVVVLIVLVQFVQSAGDRLARQFDKRTRPR